MKKKIEEVTQRVIDIVRVRDRMIIPQAFTYTQQHEIETFNFIASLLTSLLSNAEGEVKEFMEKNGLGERDMINDNGFTPAKLPKQEEGNVKVWSDVFDEFYLEHDEQISSGAFNGMMLVKFHEWVENKYPLYPSIASQPQKGERV